MQYSHLIVALIVGVIFPVYAMLNGHKTRNIIEKHPEKLHLVFQSTGVFLVCLCALVILSLYINSTELSWLGLSFLKNPLLVMSLIIVCLIGYWLLSNISISDNKIEKLKISYKDVMYLFPENKQQYKASVSVSIIAGVCEEIIFRGFLFWQLQQYMPIYAAFIITNILFALGHAGTKLKNAISTFVLGVIFSTAYLLTDSLWLAIALHIMVDFYAMIIGYKLKQKLASI